MDKKIYFRLNSDLKYINSIYGEENVFGIFIPDTNSDFSEVIIIPTFEQVCLMDSIVNTTINYNNHDIIVLDIRLVYQATKHGHPETIKSLDTENVIVNARYEHMYNKLLKENKSQIKMGIRSGIPAEALKIAVTKIMRSAMNDNSNTVRFIKQITDAEKLALTAIVETIGDEGRFSQAKVASAVGVSRLTMTNLVAKMKECRVAEVQFHGTKGTYIKILDDTILRIKGELYE